jgi:hypothetical protein
VRYILLSLDGYYAIDPISWCKHGLMPSSDFKIRHDFHDHIIEESARIADSQLKRGGDASDTKDQSSDSANTIAAVSSKVLHENHDLMEQTNDASSTPAITPRPEPFPNVFKIDELLLLLASAEFKLGNVDLTMKSFQASLKLRHSLLGVNFNYRDVAQILTRIGKMNFHLMLSFE